MREARAESLRPARVATVESFFAPPVATIATGRPWKISLISSGSGTPRRGGPGGAPPGEGGGSADG